MRRLAFGLIAVLAAHASAQETTAFEPAARKRIDAVAAELALHGRIEGYRVEPRLRTRVLLVHESRLEATEPCAPTLLVTRTRQRETRTKGRLALEARSESERSVETQLDLAHLTVSAVSEGLGAEELGTPWLGALEQDPSAPIPGVRICLPTGRFLYDGVVHGKARPVRHAKRRCVGIALDSDESVQAVLRGLQESIAICRLGAKK